MKNNQENNSVFTHWSVDYVDRILEKFPDKEMYVCASGISPSGIVHFGNMRDIITPMAVVWELQRRGKQAKLIFSWDDFDRYRKVPANVSADFAQYIGMPLSQIPSPQKGFSSYSDYFEQEFQSAIDKLGIEVEYRYQTKFYTGGSYDAQIVRAMQQREKIAQILLSLMTDKAKAARNLDEAEYIKNYYPISVYSSFTGKDSTKIIDYDGDKVITYKCLETGEIETIDITEKHIVKFAWKVDWAMRWGFEEVVFEPGGKDHSSPGGSFDAATAIAKEVFDITAPIYQGYEFVGIRGLTGKMSGSSGKAMSPNQLLEIYTPEILKWMYFKNEPNRQFSLSFDSEIYRQYGEFDKKVAEQREIFAQFAQNEDAEVPQSFDRTVLELSGVDLRKVGKESIPFRQAVGFGQIVQWNKEKLLEMLTSLGFDYDLSTLDERLRCAKSWLEEYNRDEIISILDEKNDQFAQNLTPQDRENVAKLRQGLKDNSEMSIEQLNDLVYAVVKKDELEPKEQAKLQREFFKVVYNLLINKDAGPRLSTFLWAIEDRGRVLDLLDI